MQQKAYLALTEPPPPPHPAFSFVNPKPRPSQTISECYRGSPYAELAPLALWFQLALSDDSKRLGWEASW